MQEYEIFIEDNSPLYEDARNTPKLLAKITILSDEKIMREIASELKNIYHPLKKISLYRIINHSNELEI